MGSTVTVDDLGPAADVSDGKLGAHSVCHVGAYGDDVVNNVKSSANSEGAVDEDCIVCPTSTAVSTDMDGSAIHGEGIREGATVYEGCGDYGPGHDLSPSLADMLGKITVESMVDEKNVTSY